MSDERKLWIVLKWDTSMPTSSAPKALYTSFDYDEARHHAVKYVAECLKFEEVTLCTIPHAVLSSSPQI